MLEEALTSPTFPPADAAMALLSFVRYELPAGGSSAEARFFHLFSLLCDRLFGPMAGPKDDFRHEIGGWLSRASRWERPGSTNSQSSSLNNSSTSRMHVPSPRSPKASTAIESDPVVMLLSGIDAAATKGRALPTLIDAISTESENRPGVRFPFPFQALPKPTQEVFLALLQAALTGKVEPGEPLRENAARLGGSLLCVHPKDQNSVKAYQQAKVQKLQQKRPLSLSPGLALSPPSKPTTPSNKDTTDVPPKLMLSMLEIYLFTFVHYVLAPPSSPGTSGHRTTTTMTRSGSHYQRSTVPYGDQVYHHLFRTYLRHFLPLAKTRGEFLDFPNLTRESELFVRVIVEFWLDGDMTVPTLIKAAEPIRQRRLRAGVSGEVVFDLAASYDLSAAKNYSAQASQVLKCLRSMVYHVVKDPGTPRAVAEASPTAASLRSKTVPWCLSPTMTTLQLPFYNFLRTTFRHASIHSAGSPFHYAMDSWLVWLEPWNVELRKKNAVANAKNVIAQKVRNSPRESTADDITPVVLLPKPAHRSKYSPKWKAYIAANLHLYTVPFAIFLRRARELDFSPKEFRRSLTLVQKVFRVFSPEVVHDINTLLQDGDTLSSLVSKHNEILGGHSPSTLGNLALTSCRNDMHNLLEEMYVQHLKALRELDFFDRLAAYVGMGDVTNSEEKELRAVVEKAKLIVGFPPDYEVMPDEKRLGKTSEKASKDNEQPERDRSGLLTDNGKLQVIEGSMKCSPTDVMYFGDKLSMRPTSYEIPQLVPLTIAASNYLNQRLGLDTASQQGDLERIPEDASTFETLIQQRQTSKTGAFRINLRFLADYRNILFLLLVLTIWLWRLLQL